MGRPCRDVADPSVSQAFPRRDPAALGLGLRLARRRALGAIAADFDRGINAYCWPREAIWAGGAIDRAGHPEIGRGVLEWLCRVRNASRPFAYWFQKYTIDGWPEWETPAADQTAVIPWGLERHYRRAGDLNFVASCWPMVEQAAAVCAGASGHPGLSFVNDLGLISSAGIWDSRFGAFFYTNATVVAGFCAAARLSQALGKPDEQARSWNDLADRIWHEGILREAPLEGTGPGLIDTETGRFLDARRLSTRRGFWTDRADWTIERSQAIDISLLGAAFPFDLLPAADARIGRCAEALLKHNAAKGEQHLLVRWGLQPDHADRSVALPPRTGKTPQAWQPCGWSVTCSNSVAKPATLGIGTAPRPCSMPFSAASARSA